VGLGTLRPGRLTLAEVSSRKKPEPNRLPGRLIPSLNLEAGKDINS
jgi:hypothetical protein